MATKNIRNNPLSDTGLRQIPGVSDVSPEEVIDIGPPDAPVTW